ncbi:5'-nucleotidase C-terminal domain-containing protein [Candidatus Dependentiae bacterium]|nr:5'-nucleotidase C-terminal domain-containing protein [Candidatus Dependentiae bacterium]
MKGRKLFLFLSIILIFFIFIPVELWGDQSKRKVIYIAATSDEHGHLFDYDFITGNEIQGGLIRVSSWVKDFKKKKPDLILLSAGDIIQGTPLTTLHNSKFLQEPDPMILAMNYIGYQAAALGNHDIEQGIPVVKEVIKQANFPILAANAVHENKTKKPFYKPYKVIKVEGIKIVILGMITPGIPQWLNKKVYAGIKFESIPESTEYWLRKMKKKEKPDIIVGLFHSGYGKKELKESDSSIPIENAAIITAEKNPGLDIIISGHIHKPVESALVNKVLITQPGAYAINVTLIKIELERKNKDWVIVSKTSKLISMKDYPSDKILFKKVKKYYNETKQYSETPIAEIKVDINSYYSYFKDNPITDLIHKVQLDVTGADISAAAIFNPNLEIETGEITIADIAGIYKYENFLYVRKMTGKMIKDYIEYSATFFNGTEKFEDGVISKKLKGYNYDTFEGIIYEIDLSKPEGERVIKLLESKTGNPLDPEGTYNVAMNNYRSNGGGGHLKAANALDSPIISRSNKPIRNLIIEYLQENKVVSHTPTNNWKLVQEKEVLLIVEKKLHKIKTMR